DSVRSGRWRRARARCSGWADGGAWSIGASGSVDVDLRSRRHRLVHPLEIAVAQAHAAVRHALAEKRMEDGAVDDVSVAHVERELAEREVVVALAGALRRQVALFDER